MLPHDLETAVSKTMPKWEQSVHACRVVTTIKCALSTHCSLQRVVRAEAGDVWDVWGRGKKGLLRYLPLAEGG